MALICSTQFFSYCILHSTQTYITHFCFKCLQSQISSSVRWWCNIAKSPQTFCFRLSVAAFVFVLPKACDLTEPKPKVWENVPRCPVQLHPRVERPEKLQGNPLPEVSDRSASLSPSCVNSTNSKELNAVLFIILYAAFISYKKKPHSTLNK